MKKKVIKLTFISFLILFILNISYNIKKLYSQADEKGQNNKDKKNKKFLKEALFYERLDNNKLRCNLCPRHCLLSDGQVGFCRVRQNIGGVLYSLNYGMISVMNVDPVEKKPFFHFLPSSKAFSIASPGCNLRCKYCQNWDISQRGVNETDNYIPPSNIVELALKSGAKSIAYTYSEPIVFYEYIIDTARIAREKGLKNIVVTSGFINTKPLEELLKYIDAIKVDLKGFNEDFYIKYTSSRLKPILESLKTIKKSNRHLEIVNLIIPGVNDNEEDIRRLSRWIKENLGNYIPLHFTRFYPNYQMTQTPPTPLETLIKARKIAMEEGLKYVYTGNVDYPPGEDTYCNDGSIAIERHGFFVVKNNLKNGRCSDGTKIYGVFE